MTLPKAIAAVALLALIASPTPTFAKKPEGHPGKGKIKVERTYAPKPTHAPFFTSTDDWAVRNHAAARPVAWTGLPPGIAKNYARGKRLPPGIAKKLSPQLLARLPQRPGYEYAQVGADIVLIESATRLVVDILKDVFN
jgi:hypothetical protein